MSGPIKVVCLSGNDNETPKIMRGELELKIQFDAFVEQLPSWAAIDSEIASIIMESSTYQDGRENYWVETLKMALEKLLHKALFEGFNAVAQTEFGKNAMTPMEDGKGFYNTAYYAAVDVIKGLTIEMREIESAKIKMEGSI